MGSEIRKELLKSVELTTGMQCISYASEGHYASTMPLKGRITHLPVSMYASLEKYSVRTQAKYVY